MTPNRCTQSRIFRNVPVRCGRCQACLSLKRWRKRLSLEWETIGSDRTWFVTLTFRDPVPPTEQEAYTHVQKWLKRVRKALDTQVRFACVTEYGNLRGRVHYHLLLFVHGSVRYRHLVDWPHGHSQYRLGDRAGVRYVSKYIAKEGVKFRASQKMGQSGFKKISETAIVQEVLRAFPGATIRSVTHRGHKMPVLREFAIEPPDDPWTAFHKAKADAERQEIREYFKRLGLEKENQTSDYQSLIETDWREEEDELD